MGMQQRDYLLRMITAAAAVARRLRERLSGGADADEVAREARDAQGELLGRDGPIIAQLDAGSAVGLLRDRRRILQWAELIRIEGEARRTAGEEEKGLALERRAQAIEREAAKLPGGMDGG